MSCGNRPAIARFAYAVLEPTREREFVLVQTIDNARQQHREVDERSWVIHNVCKNRQNPPKHASSACGEGGKPVRDVVHLVDVAGNVCRNADLAGTC